MQLMMVLVRVPDGVSTDDLAEVVTVALAEQYEASEVVEVSGASDTALL